MMAYTFTFESQFKTKRELIGEVEQLLWKMRHTWPLSMDTNDLRWIQSKTNKAVIKLSGGYCRHGIEEE